MVYICACGNKEFTLENRRHQDAWGRNSRPTLICTACKRAYDVEPCNTYGLRAVRPGDVTRVTPKDRVPSGEWTEMGAFIAGIRSGLESVATEIEKSTLKGKHLWDAVSQRVHGCSYVQLVVKGWKEE